MINRYMIHLLHLLSLYNNQHNLSRYIRFIQSRKNIKMKGMHRHHILPKANDFFSEFRNLNIHKWNSIYLSPREHHIAHRMLHRAFPGSSQTFAFYNMSNQQKRMKSRDYETSKIFHINRLISKNQCPNRCAKISNALRGKPKSATHIQNMIGHIVTDKTREKLRIANTGKIMTAVSRNRMSATRTGKKKASLSLQSKKNIAVSKMSFTIITPYGEFASFTHFADYTGIEETVLKNIYRNLNKIPRSKNLDLFGIANPDKNTWNKLGFTKT